MVIIRVVKDRLSGDWIVKWIEVDTKVLMEFEALRMRGSMGR